MTFHPVPVSNATRIGIREPRLNHSIVDNFHGIDGLVSAGEQRLMLGSNASAVVILITKWDFMVCNGQVTRLGIAGPTAEAIGVLYS
jgi:hypothetical protein